MENFTSTENIEETENVDIDTGLGQATLTLNSANWMQTTQADFGAGDLVDVEAADSGDAMLASAGGGVVEEIWVKRYDYTEKQDIARDVAVDSSGNVYVTGESRDSSRKNDYATIKYSSDGTEEWVKHYDCDGKDAEARSVAVDSSGNVYVTGESTGSSGYDDYATVKYSPDGNEEWVRRYDCDGKNDQAYDVAVDSSGNVYVTGYTAVAGANPDYLTVKYSPDGNEEWVRRYDYSHDRALFVAVDSSGNVYVTGCSASSSGNTDYATVKYSPDGDEEWVRRYDCTGRGDHANDMAVDSSGNVYVTGVSYSSSVNYDYATVKYSSDGTQKWVRRYDYARRSDSASSVAVDSSGNVYVTGYSFKTSDWDSMDYATVKYSSDGTQKWVRRYDYAGKGDSASSVAVDSSGNVYVTGYFEDSSWNKDYATIKYSSDGTRKWVKLYDGGSRDYAHDMAVDSSGNVYVTGGSWRSSGYDYATVKYGEMVEYKPSGTLTSVTEDVGKTVDWGEITWSEDTPSETDITMEVSVDGGSWVSVNSGDDIDQIGDRIQYRATLSTDDTSVTPVLHDVSIDYSWYESSGTIVSVPFDSEGDSGG